MHWTTRPETAGFTSWLIYRDGGGADVLEVGRQRLPLAEVAAVEVARTEERDIDGKALVVSTFMLGAAVLILGVVAWGWRTRILAGALLLAGIGLAAAVEIIRAGRIVTHRVEVVGRDGRRLVFTTASPVERDAFLTSVEGPRTRPLRPAA